MVAGGAAVPFVLFPGQERVAGDLVVGLWLLILKARQLGLTWLVLAYALWRMVFTDNYQVLMISHGEEYVLVNLERLDYLIDRLPAWCRPVVVSQPKGKRVFANGSEIRCLYPGPTPLGQKKAGRTFSGDLAILDEAAFTAGLKLILGGLTPAMTRSGIGPHPAGKEALTPTLSHGEREQGGVTLREAAGYVSVADSSVTVEPSVTVGEPSVTVELNRDGQMVVISTSDGPTGDFAELWGESYGSHGEVLDEQGVGPTKYKPTFLGWFERPGRTPEWRLEQDRKLGKMRASWEYPATIEEALQSGQGRVYPQLTVSKHMGDLPEIPEYAEQFRAVDWGESGSAFVVLWGAHIKGPPGLLISPSCPHTIREHLGWKYDDSGRPLKKDDHTCDALCYAVSTFDLRGLVYIYRERYVLDAAEKGLTPAKEARTIHELSGWRKTMVRGVERWIRGVRGEKFSLGTVTDPSWKLVQNQFCDMQIPCVPARIFKGAKSGGGLESDKPIDAKAERIRMVRELIDATENLDFYGVRRQQREAFSMTVRGSNRRLELLKLALAARGG